VLVEAGPGAFGAAGLGAAGAGRVDGVLGLGKGRGVAPVEAQAPDSIASAITIA
jgi:hypothetical protein